MLSLAALAAAPVLTSCGHDKEAEPPEETTPVENYFYEANEYWSSQLYLGAKLMEIHTNVTDYQFSCQTPEGYQLELVKQPEKDSEGLVVYYLEMDMAEMTESSSSGQEATLSIPIVFTGTTLDSGETVATQFTKTVKLVRYFRPVVESGAMAKNWVLVKDEKTVFSDWITFNEVGNPVYNAGETISYDASDSPLSIKVSTDSYGKSALTYFNSSDSLPGWLQTSTGVKLPVTFSDGLWTTGADPEPAVCYVGESEIYCMSIEYNENGDMIAVHRYTLQAVDLTE